jgi:hypothetical protein
MHSRCTHHQNTTLPSKQLSAAVAPPAVILNVNLDVRWVQQHQKCPAKSQLGACRALCSLPQQHREHPATSLVSRRPC